MNSVVLGLLFCVLLDCLCGVLIPDGQIKGMVSQVINLYIFYILIMPVIEHIV